MQAVGLTHYPAMDNPDSLADFQLPVPQATGHDIRVAVKAVAVNPVDNRVRTPKNRVEPTPRVLGWDAAGVVDAVGPGVTLFKPGDKVYYAGEIGRPGSYSEYHLVDERLVGAMPASLAFEAAASLPFASITAWEALFHRMRLPMDGQATGQSLLIIGAAGGVGSMAVQLAARLAGLEVIATASRPESQAWVLQLGARHAINHHQDIAAQLRALGYPQVDHVLIMSDLDRYFPVAAEVVAPQGTVGSIVPSSAPVDLNLLWDKSAHFAWEMIFTRTDFRTADMAQHGQLLNALAAHIDRGAIVAPVNEILSPINKANIHAALTRLHRGHTLGKIVLQGFRPRPA